MQTKEGRFEVAAINNAPAANGRCFFLKKCKPDSKIGGRADMPKVVTKGGGQTPKAPLCRAPLRRRLAQQSLLPPLADRRKEKAAPGWGGLIPAIQVWGSYIPMPPIPPMPPISGIPPPPAPLGSGFSATIASVVISRPATEAASRRAVRTTLVGSTMPAFTMSV